MILTKELRERKKETRAKSERWNRSQIQNALQISKVRVNQRRKGQKSLIALKLSDMKNNWQREIKMHSSPSPQIASEMPRVYLASILKFRLIKNDILTH